MKGIILLIVVGGIGGLFRSSMRNLRPKLRRKKIRHTNSTSMTGRNRPWTRRVKECVTSGSRQETHNRPERGDSYSTL